MFIQIAKLFKSGLIFEMAAHKKAASKSCFLYMNVDK